MSFSYLTMLFSCFYGLLLLTYISHCFTLILSCLLVSGVRAYIVLTLARCYVIGFYTLFNHIYGVFSCILALNVCYSTGWYWYGRCSRPERNRTRVDYQGVTKLRAGDNMKK